MEDLASPNQSGIAATPVEPGRCPLSCVPASSTELFLAPADISGELFRVVRCQKCHTIYLDPRPTAAGLAPFYADDYYGPDNKKFDDVTERAVAWFVWWRARLLSRYMPRGGRVLDVGCGRGNFLEAMHARGYEVFGTELSELSASRARAIFNDRVKIGDLRSADWPRGSFDMVTLWHVIEHLDDPLGYIRRAHDLLRPGGVIVLAQPNIDSIQAVIGGPKWFHLDVPRHLFHFDPETLAALVNRAGFSVIRESHLSIEQNPYGLLQSTLNRLGIRQNALYHVIKDDGARPISPGARRALLALYYTLMPAAIALTTIGSLLRRGGSFYLVGRKA